MNTDGCVETPDANGVISLIKNSPLTHAKYTNKLSRNNVFKGLFLLQ